MRAYIFVGALVFRSFPRTRLRRSRSHPSSRALYAEHRLSLCDLAWPVFVKEGLREPEPIARMPGQHRFGIDGLLKQAHEAYALGLRALALFPCIDPALKDAQASQAFDPEGLIPRTLRALKKECPGLLLIADVALDPYTDHGHDGLLNAQGDVDNDRTLEALVRQALHLAQSGADIVAPSDMMDGRVGAIRAALESHGHHNTQILAYAAKYASHFYGPFREAVGSLGALKSDKQTYQMQASNVNEALWEVALDLEEGADAVMVKPGMPYLDVLYRIKERFAVPTWVYQVSGEYSMLRGAIDRGDLPESVIEESLIAFKRAGADVILTYFALEVARRFSTR